MDGFSHYISLGWFCSTALELERIGLRDCSSPFDWLLTDWGGIIYNIDSHFKDWLRYENLYQNTENRKIYKDIKQGITFMHDFNGRIPLRDQIDRVQKKYNRRIGRFYQNIQEPTLFLRYINTDKGETDEIFQIQEQYETIKKLLRKYNRNNDIIFIVNRDMQDKVTFPAFFVDKDENDNVARKFLDKNALLLDVLNECKFDCRENMDRYYKQEIERKKFTKRIERKIKAITETKYLKGYIHEKQY